MRTELHINLSEEESLKLAEILLSPPKEPTEEWKRAWKVHKENVQEIEEN
jgi:hypothetical protein